MGTEIAFFLQHYPARKAVFACARDMQLGHGLEFKQKSRDNIFLRCNLDLKRRSQQTLHVLHLPCTRGTSDAEWGNSTAAQRCSEKVAVKGFLYQVGLDKHRKVTFELVV